MDINKFKKLKELSSDSNFEIIWLKVEISDASSYVGIDNIKALELLITGSARQIPEKTQEVKGTKYILTANDMPFSFFIQTDDINQIAKKIKNEISNYKNKELERLKVARQERLDYIKSIDEKIEMVNKYWK